MQRAGALQKLLGREAHHLQLGALAGDELCDGAAEVWPGFLLQHACTKYSTSKPMVQLRRILTAVDSSCMRLSTPDV